MDILQIVICALGVLAIRGVQSDNPVILKWANLIGLLSQPFWFYMSYQAEMWGVFILGFFYVEAWWQGVHKHWFKKSIDFKSKSE